MPRSEVADDRHDRGCVRELRHEQRAAATYDPPPPVTAERAIEDYLVREARRRREVTAEAILVREARRRREVYPQVVAQNGVPADPPTDPDEKPLSPCLVAPLGYDGRGTVAAPRPPLAHGWLYPRGCTLSGAAERNAAGP